MTLLAGRYTLDVPLGDSDLGTVWSGHDADGVHVVAIVLESDAPEALADRFRAHGKALLKTSHPSLVHAIAAGDENGAPYLVVERLTGESLATRLEAGPALTVARVVEIGTALAEALAAVHAAGISHGDVEPGNVLLVGEPGKEVPKLIGFGLNRASVRQELGVRMSLPSLGAAAYAAPEQARGDSLDGPLADQASLAAVLYAALGGRPPHIARDVAALAVAIGSEKPPLITMARRELAPFASTIDRALSSDPKKRFTDMTAFGRALRTAGTMARSIASSTVPLGPRSAIGEPPAPALPRAATIPRPAGALGAARVPGPGKLAVAIPKPGAAVKVGAVASDGASSSRTTEELEIGDLMAATAKPAAPPTSTPQPPPKAPSATSTPQPQPKAPSATSTPQPPPKAPSATERTTEELDVSELQVASVPPPAVRDSGELESIEMTSIPPTPPQAAAADEAPAVSVATTTSDEAPAAAAQLAPPEAEPAAKPHAAPPPPPPPPPPPAEEAEEPLVQLSPSLEKISTTTATPTTDKPKPKPPAPKEPAPIAFSLDAQSPPEEEIERLSLEITSGRKPWVVPAAIAGVALLAIVSWFGYRATRTETPTGPAGHTLTITAPPETSGPPTTVAEVPPTTVAEVPPTTVAEVPPPSTVVTPPPPTTVARVEPPPTTTTHVPPATTTRPPTTTTRPPPTTTARTRPPTTSTRPPTTGTRPPPTTTARRPPPTTTSRPTVVSDPGF